MTDRQKFWMKVFLFLTFPAWLPLLVVGAIVATPFVMVWMAVDSIVDPPKKYGSCKRFP